MSKVKIGQIGVGHAHASGKMNVYRQSDEFEVVGVVEPDAALRRRAEKSATYRDLKWMTREQLLGTPGLRAVAVETRVEDLLETAQVCIDAGMHIHLDKPAGASLPKFKRLLDDAARRHLLVQMGYMYRYSPAVVLMRDFLSRGWLGRPFEVHAVMSKVVPPATRASLARFRGGIMFELGCHIIDLVVKTLGRPDDVTAFSQHAAEGGDALQDNMLAVFKYPKALASVKSAALEVEGFARRHFVVCGDEGTLHIQPLDAPHIRVAFSGPHDKYVKGYQDIRIGKYPRYVGDAADMAKIIQGKKDPDFTYDHDYAVQETVLKSGGMSTT